MSISPIQPCALVTGATQLSYGMVRSLGEAGVRVALACHGEHPACRSRYVHHLLALRDGVASPRNLAMLGEYALSRRTVTVVFPHTEQWAKALTREGADLPQRLLTPYPTREHHDLDRVFSKQRMQRFCLEQGVAAPRTMNYVPGEAWSAFLEEAVAAVPVVLKPDTKQPGRRGFELDVHHFADAASLRAWSERHFATAAPDFPLVAQSYIPGPVTNIVAFHGYKSAAGGLYMLGLRKLRTYPAHCGSTTTAALCRSPRVVTALAERFMAMLPYAGPFDLEFKQHAEMSADDPRAWHFIELNPRCGLPSYAATAAGLNLPKLAYDEALGKPLPEPSIVSDVPIGWTDLAAHLQTLREMPPRRSLSQALLENRRTFRTCARTVHTYANRRDPAVLTASISGELRRYLAHVKQALRSRLNKVSIPQQGSRDVSDEH